MARAAAPSIREWARPEIRVIWKMREKSSPQERADNRAVQSILECATVRESGMVWFLSQRRE